MLSSRDRFLKVLNGDEVDRVPVFPLLMFFSADRAGISYREFASNGEALANSQLLVQEKFGLDAITSCSDAFRISADLGGDMAYPIDHPPHLNKPLIRSANDLKDIVRPDPMSPNSRMKDRVLASEMMVKAVDRQVAVLGWIDMPFAEACSVCGVTEFMSMLYEDPKGAHEILDFLTPIVIDFALAQVAVGVDMIGAGDAAASLISPKMYSEFALPYEQRVCDAIHLADNLVKLHICGNTTKSLKYMALSGADLFNVDHMVPLEDAKEVYSTNNFAYKGNLDPVTDIYQAGPEKCQSIALEAIKLTEGTKYMLSAGCEIPAATPDDVFRAFCEAPKIYQAKRA